jgi:HEAT repeat protein
MEELDALLSELHTSPRIPGQESLYCLSNLEPKGLVRVREAWIGLPSDMRQGIITRLADLAEADFEVNFGAVFRLGMEDNDAQVRVTAIEGLWEDEDVFLIPSLVICLREDESDAVRATAATSLGRFVLLGELEKIRPGPYALAYESLLATWRDGEETLEVRRRALESLAYAGTSTVKELIGDTYATSEGKMRVSAIFAMGRSADTCWATQVRQELFTPNPEMRYEAARACGELELRDAVTDLEELTDDVDPEVQEAAIWALGQIGGDQARQILERHCSAADEAIRTAAEAALSELEFLHGDLTEFITRLIESPEQ